jgi:hypothetical protein
VLTETQRWLVGEPFRRVAELDEAIGRFDAWVAE